jgi:peptide/nickel transport system substrate-binding protein
MKRSRSASHAALLITLLAALFGAVATLHAAQGGELRFCVRAEPRNLHPLVTVDDVSDTVRYLTGGVLIRVNRSSQQAEPELATSWTVSRDYRSISFHIRTGVKFSDGTPFGPADVEYTFRQLLDPKLEAPLADSFRVGATGPGSGVPLFEIRKDVIKITFPSPIADFVSLFDQLPILSGQSKLGIKAVLGPFMIKDYKPGIELLLERNPNYWKTDAQGHRLPYLDSVRLPIQQNRETELTRFRRGDVQLIDTIDPAIFDQLAKEMPDVVRDSGPSLDSEVLWVNQASNAPFPAYKKQWFNTQAFRVALSDAIRRADLCRIVYHGHAHPAYGPISPSNTFWFNQKLKAPDFNMAAAMKELNSAGFALRNKILYDSAGHPVEFSLITNSGNETRGKIAVMLQQDLGAIGIKLNLVTLDFKSLIERITASSNYEACLLGLRRIELDPNSQMNVWLSSGPNHQFNPSQKSPATAWEAEIDTLMRKQTSEIDRVRRKAYFDRVQEIAAEQQPFIYLVNPNSLSAVARTLKNTSPTPLPPQLVWNAEYLTFQPNIARGAF